MNFNTRAKMFGDTAETQQAFVAREDVKEFLRRVRSFAGQTRAGKVVSTGNVVSVPKTA